MINTIQAIVLGLTQGLTEYIPISSSTHLILLPKIFGWDFELKNKLLFNVFIQTGTMCGLVYYYRRNLHDIILEFFNEISKNSFTNQKINITGWLIIFATVPTGFIGFFFKKRILKITELTNIYTIIAACLCLTSLMLFIAAFYSKKNKRLKKNKLLTIGDAIIIGFIQAFSLIPGISRLGSTISAGIFLGLQQEIAIKFSFLISIPIALGASVAELIQIMIVLEKSYFLKIWQSLFIGWLVAAFSGYMVVDFFINFLKRNSLVWFAVYCALLGILIFLYMAR